MATSLSQRGAALLCMALLAASPLHRESSCDDPLPIDPAVVTKEMKLKAFRGTQELGPACHLSWEGGSSPGLLIYGPSALADLGRKFTSAKQAADQYAAESPKGVEPILGVANGYMVFDPKVPNRRLFVEYKHKVYMIVSQDEIPLATLAKALIQR